MKGIVLMLAMILCSGIVIAGEIGPITYKDRVMFWDTTRQTSTQTVDIDADTVAGTDIVSYVQTKEAAWSRDGNGMNRNELSLLLYGSKDLFTQYDYYDVLIQSRFEAINLRLDKIEGLVRGIPTGQVTAERLGRTIDMPDGSICSDFGCFRFE